jgi:hypothetical protein
MTCIRGENYKSVIGLLALYMPAYIDQLLLMVKTLALVLEKREEHPPPPLPFNVHTAIMNFAYL